MDGGDLFPGGCSTGKLAPPCGGGGAVSPAFGGERGLCLAGLIVLPPFLKCLGACPEDRYLAFDVWRL